MRIRPARRADLDQVVRNEEASFSVPWSRGTFVELLSRLNVLFRVVEDDEGRVIAHGILWHVDDEGELANMAVCPDSRRRGIATRLLDALLAEAGLRGVARVFLEVRDSNESARHLYAARGFETVGRRPNYYSKPREDAQVLRIDLEPDLSRMP